MTPTRFLLTLLLLAGPAAAQTPTVQSVTITQAPTQAGQAVRLGDLQAAMATALPSAAPCTLYGGTGTAGASVAVSLGTGLACVNNVVTATGGGSGTAGVSAFNGRTGAVTLAAPDVAALGFATVAQLPTVPATGTTAGTVAAGNDARITGALSASTAATTYLPLAGGTLTGALSLPTPAAGDNSTRAATTAFVTASIAGLSGGSGGSYTLPAASPSVLGGIKLGSTLTINPATNVVDVVTTAPIALLGAIQASDIFPMVRQVSGVAVPYTVTGTQLVAFANGGAQAPAIVIAAPGTTPTAGTAFALTASLANYSSQPTLTYSVDGGAFGALPAPVFTPSSGAPTSVSWQEPALTAAAHTIVVKDAAGTTSNTLSVTPSAAAPAVATAYTLALSSTSGTVGSPVTLTFTPTGGTWPSGEVLTPTAAGVAGAFSSTTLSPTGSAAATVTWTPSAAGAATLAATSSPAMTNPTGQSYNAAAAPANVVLASAAPQAIGLAGQAMTFNVPYTGTWAAPAVTVDGAAVTPTATSAGSGGVGTVTITAPAVVASGSGIHTLQASAGSSTVSTVFEAQSVASTLQVSWFYAQTALPVISSAAVGEYTAVGVSGGGSGVMAEVTTTGPSAAVTGGTAVTVTSILTGWSTSRVVPPSAALLRTNTAWTNNTAGNARTFGALGANLSNADGSKPPVGVYYPWTIATFADGSVQAAVGGTALTATIQ